MTLETCSPTQQAHLTKYTDTCQYVGDPSIQETPNQPINQHGGVKLEGTNPHPNCFTLDCTSVFEGHRQTSSANN